MATLFFEPKYKEASEQISIESPADARASVKWLTEEYKSAKTRAKLRRLIRFAVLARNRAKAMLKRKNLSAKERKEFKEIIKIYDRWIEEHRLTKPRRKIRY